MDLLEAVWNFLTQQGSRFVYYHKRDKPDPRDLVVGTFHKPIPKEELPLTVDLRKTGFVPPVLSQGKTGTCAPHAISNALRYCLRRENKTDIQPSRLWIYWYGRLLDGTLVSRDVGMTIRNGLKAVSKYGAPDEILQPYVVANISKQPTKEATEAGGRSQLREFMYLSVPQDLTAIKNCLARGRPIVLGLQIYNSFESESTLKTGVVPMPKTTDRLLGGHAVALYGYNDKRRVFLLMNSWGVKFGDKGWFYIPYAYIVNPALASDLWCLTFFE